MSTCRPHLFQRAHTASREGIGGRTWFLAAALSAAALPAGCGDRQEATLSRLNPRTVPYLTGVAVPAGFDLIESNTEDYESGGQRWARHRYRGFADVYAVRNFYREQMPLLGWNRVSDQNVKGVITIRFEKQNETCAVEIKPDGPFNRCSIQVILNPFSRNPTEPPSKRPMP